MKYFMMRHGDAGAHVADRVADKRRPLLPEGRVQVASSVAKLQKDGQEPTDVYFDSTSKRCEETADIAGKLLGLQPKGDPRLAEAEYARKSVKDESGNGAKPLFVTHDHVIGFLDGDLAGEDWPKTGEIRKYKNAKEKARFKP